MIASLMTHRYNLFGATERRHEMSPKPAQAKAAQNSSKSSLKAAPKAATKAVLTLVSAEDLTLASSNSISSKQCNNKTGKHMKSSKQM